MRDHPHSHTPAPADDPAGAEPAEPDTGDTGSADESPDETAAPAAAQTGEG